MGVVSAKNLYHDTENGIANHASYNMHVL